ncbi:MAG: thioredoxin family protein [Planctomycetaceae bacterium]|nr:thioredoxin family protein [Planctomycetaceae bacterium]
MRPVYMAVIGLFFAISPVPAQDLGLSFDLGESVGEAQEQEIDVVSAFTLGDQPGTVNLQVRVTLPEGANTYSQDPSFSKPTTITVKSKGWTPLGAGFAPDHPPKVAFDELFNQELGKFTGTVTFSRRYLAPTDVDPEQAMITGEIDMLICDAETCQPQTIEFEAAFAENGLPKVAETKTKAPSDPEVGESFPSLFAPETPNSSGEPAMAALSETISGMLAEGYRTTPGINEGTSPVQLQFELSSLKAKAGDTATLAITLFLDEGWSTYALEKADESQIELPTVIKLDPTGLTAIGEILSVPDPEIHDSEIGTRSASYTDRVTWVQRFTVDDAENYGVAGSIRYQICETGKSCMPPKQVKFSLGSIQDPSHLASAEPISTSYVNVASTVSPSPEPDEEADSIAASVGQFEVEDEGKIASLPVALGAAFLAGLILNIMPCVLPVLAIKILSFVQQAGESRGRILALNLSYTAGVVSIFMALALLASVFQVGWGGQFQDDRFVIGLIFVVFAMGLSLLGVFELPVPGLIPSANDHSEGLGGAFNTGIIATLLATPCSGPLMAPVFAFTLSQSKPVIFLIFGVMGLGMASPYLLAGFFPAIVNWLPKPGMWMVRFKQFSGFVLMGTVLWLMYSVDPSRQVPVLFMLLAIALLLWMVGNLYDLSTPAQKKWTVRVASLLVAAPIFWWGVSGYQSAIPLVASPEMMAEIHSETTDGVEIAEVDWSRFSEQRLLELRGIGKPMLIDFTADWCAVCKTNEKFALNTEPVVEFLREHEIVPMMADYTKPDPEIRKWLKQFGQDMVPLTVIIPPGTSSKVIALRGLYSQSTLLEKLEQAMTSTDKVADSGGKSPKFASNSTRTEE